MVSIKWSNLRKPVKASREDFQNTLTRLRTEYKDALVRIGHRKAFDNLVESWSSELEALTNCDSLKLMDNIFLLSEVDNRMILDDIQKQIEKLYNIEENNNLYKIKKEE
jgi:hypothetical protein